MLKRIIIGIIVTIVIFIGFAGFFWMYEARFMIGRASVNQATISVDNSYVFVTPLKARANSLDKIRITVFLLNNQGLGVMGKTIVLGFDNKLKIDAVQETTDANGKTVFDISAANTGEYFIEIKVDNITLPQKAHVSFN
ncbi:hypothetical protein HGA88_00265 [Candidatus Roizmanbacteria bacterium]|nr:hypothetical protein [Candidatus Roizmanbacteria bacterium]